MASPAKAAGPMSPETHRHRSTGNPKGDRMSEYPTDIVGTEITSVRLVIEPDYDADLSYLGDASNYEGCGEDEIARYLEQDRERLAAYDRGEWRMVGIYAEAKTRFRTRVGGWYLGPTVRTPGVWGIEDDYTDMSDMLSEHKDEELDTLADMLRALGMDAEAVDVSVKSYEVRG